VRRRLAAARPRHRRCSAEDLSAAALHDGLARHPRLVFATAASAGAAAAQKRAFAVVTLLAAADQLDCAMAILVAYCGLLRIGEALSLTCDAVVFGQDFAVLHLGKTKRGKADRVVLADAGVVALLRRYLAHTGRQRSQRLFWCSYSKLRVWLKRATDHLGFTDVAFRSHSLRRGAATELFAARVPLERIMMFGRWASESNCRLYLHQGEVALISTLRSQRQWALIEALARLAPQVLVDS